MQRYADDASRWWGGRGRSEDRLNILDLVRAGTLDIETAALLWLLVEKKASVIVAAGPQLSGKTTVLTAALDLMPPWYERVYISGQEEDFSFLSRTDSSSAYILVPELSDHTPAYLWGDAVRTLFDALDRGYSLAATMHAESPGEIMGLLGDDPVKVTDGLLSNINVIVNLRMLYGESDIVRRVSLLSVVAQGVSGVQGPPEFLPLVRWDSERDAHVHEPSAEARQRWPLASGWGRARSMPRCASAPGRWSHGSRATRLTRTTFDKWS